MIPDRRGRSRQARLVISRKAIQRCGDAIAAAFKPRKLILFGSHACGKPTEGSDVDVMVVMARKRYRRDLGWRIPVKVPLAFPLDMLVEPEDRLEKRIEDRESFILDVTERGKIMYEGIHS